MYFSYLWMWWNGCGRLVVCDISYELHPKLWVFCRPKLIINTCRPDAKIYLNIDTCINITEATRVTRVTILTSDPVIVAHQWKETRPATHVPDTYTLVSAATSQERARVGATEQKLKNNYRLKYLIFSPVLVISASGITSSLVDSLGGSLWSPCDTLHHMVVISHLHLDILPW